MDARNMIECRLATHMEIELNTEVDPAVRFSVRQGVRWPVYDTTDVEINQQFGRTILSEVRVLRTTNNPRRDQ
jgi:hypothetical protein